jgi:hypothetical protein
MSPLSHGHGVSPKAPPTWRRFPKSRQNASCVSPLAKISPSPLRRFSLQAVAASAFQSRMLRRLDLLDLMLD